MLFIYSSIVYFYDSSNNINKEVTAMQIKILLYLSEGR